MKLQSIFRISASLAGLALLLTIGSSNLAAQKPDSEEISALLSQAKSHAVQAEDDAANLEAFTRSRVSWKLHGESLERIKQHVNSLGVVSKQLTDLRDQGSPWQQKAINQIDPLLREMATSLDTTIKHLNENQSNVHMLPYRQYTAANHDLAEKLAEVIKDFVEYDEAQSKPEALEQKLELPAGSKGE
jgi:hypothetical protein